MPGQGGFLRSANGVRSVCSHLACVLCRNQTQRANSLNRRNRIVPNRSQARVQSVGIVFDAVQGWFPFVTCVSGYLIEIADSVHSPLKQVSQKIRTRRGRMQRVVAMISSGSLADLAIINCY